MISLTIWFSLLLVSLVLLFIGSKVIFTKRPLIISSKLFRCIMLVVILPLFFKNMDGHMENLMPALLWILLVVINWRQSNGYSIFGIANPQFRESLIATLNKLNIPFHEDLSGISIPSQNINLEVISISTGISRIRIKDKPNPAWLKQLAKALREYYKTTPVKVTLALSIFYLLFGILMGGSIILSLYRVMSLSY